MPSSKLAESIFEAEQRSLTDNPLRRPVSTYRLQLHKGFTIAQARAIVPYLHDLGIVDAYLSPFLDAKPGSMHGYDVFDHSRIHSEVGDDHEHGLLVQTLADRGMGRVLDIVPNHMGVNGPNRFWLDMLELGRMSPFAAFFDVDWHPVKEELEGRVLLPILEDQYGIVLEAGKLTLDREGGRFVIRYSDHTFPITPKSYAIILGEASRELASGFDQDDPNVLELLSIWASAETLPPRNSNHPEDVSHWLREQHVLPTRIARLCKESSAVNDLIDRTVMRFRGEPGDPSSFDRLHQLLEAQIYRLSSWKVAAQEINYRRFFDVNELAGLRTDDPRVFETIHATLFGWVANGGVTALRVDHPDGLADPLEYFQRLQESAFLVRCRARFVAEGADDADWYNTATAIRKRFRKVAAEPSSSLARPFPILAEKILSRDEQLPEDWPIDGTVGYESLNTLNGLFIDPSAQGPIDSIYGEFTGDREPFAEVLYRAKLLITNVSLASEINTLSRQLNRITEGDRRSRDFTLNDLRMAIRQVIACFPVYRTYLRPGETASKRDADVINDTVECARRKTPSLDQSLFDLLRRVLLQEGVEGLTTEARTMRDVFVRRFQQTTGPIQAKGLEDTAFYRQVPLLSRNEVGANPSRFGIGSEEFHGLNLHRLERWPGAMNTTSTHDTKRGEDARLRIDAISEYPENWRACLDRWSSINDGAKTNVHGIMTPSRAEEYLFYQALLGAWPFGKPGVPPTDEFVMRLQAYMVKAIREAKVNTSWNDPDPSYAVAMSKFVEQVLKGERRDEFLSDFEPFRARIARVGIVHSLTQSLLKIASPGVPDIYQGSELWDLSLVDPDNRRPIDYETRRASLARIDESLAKGRKAELARELLASFEDGVIKQYVLTMGLRHRREYPETYATGAYRPIQSVGKHADRVIGFARRAEDHSILAIGSRLVSPLMGEDATRMPLGTETWGDTHIMLNEEFLGRSWRDIYTDQVVRMGDNPRLDLARVFSVLPVALLVAE